MTNALLLTIALLTNGVAISFPVEQPADKMVPPRSEGRGQRAEVRTKGAYRPEVGAQKAVLGYKNPYLIPPIYPNTARTNLLWEWKAEGWVAPGVYEQCPFPIQHFDVRFTVESSPDLRNWSPYLVTNFNGPTWGTKTRFSVPMPQTKPMEFFRIRPEMVEHTRNLGIGESDRIEP